MTTFDDSAGIALWLTSVAIGLLLYVWVALSLSALFRKSGEEAWKGWVPILNNIVVLRLGGLSGWLYALVLIPVAGILAVWVCTVLAAHRINLAFGYRGGMTVLAALLFPVWATILGFGSARWIGRERPGGGPVRSGTTGAPPPLPSDAGRPADAPPYAPSYTPSAPIPPIPPLPVAGRSGPESVPPQGGWTPPPLPPVPADEVSPGFDDAADWTGEVTGAVPGAPAPISAVPLAAVPLDVFPEEAGPRRATATPPVTRVPAAAPPPTREPWAPAPSPIPGEGEAFPETSGPVSAIAGAPDAGAPRAARASVSSQHPRPHIPEEDALDQTIVARRKRTGWAIQPPAGAAIPLTASVAILGRRPAFDPAHPSAQLVALDDDTRTISKTHARLELRDDRWYITDLDSTNGVLFTTLMGTEVAVAPGDEVEAGDHFFLGDAEIRIVRSDG